MSAPDSDRLFGEQGLTNEDLAYDGSRYSEVKAALLENPYQAVWNGPNDAWPHYKSTLGQVFKGILPFGGKDQMKLAAMRTVDSFADLRWGEHGKGFRRILHPNGVCLFGVWEITEDNPFSGYYSKGSRGLVVLRLSPNGSETERGQSKSLGLVGKIYPTTDENHAEALRPANFFTQEDLGGERTIYLNDAVFRNAPDTTALQGLMRAVVLGRLGATFKKADVVPDVRQTHEVSELALGDGDARNAPDFFKLQMSPGQHQIAGDGIDFRDEIYSLLYEPGNPEPKTTLSFDISVSNDGESKGPPIKRKVTVRNWQTIGRIVCNQAVASYNGDHVIHFHHPLWRTDRNDPATVHRRPRT